MVNGIKSVGRFERHTRVETMRSDRERDWGGNLGKTTERIPVNLGGRMGYENFRNSLRFLTRETGRGRVTGELDTRIDSAGVNRNYILGMTL